MKLVYSKQAVKFIDAQDKPTKERLKTAIEMLLLDPPRGDIKVLTNYTPTSYRLRVGKYRIKYYYEDENIIAIDRIKSRGKIYK